MSPPVHWETIHKGAAPPVVPPQLADYDRACSTFSWSQARPYWPSCPEAG